VPAAGRGPVLPELAGNEAGGVNQFGLEVLQARGTWAVRPDPDQPERDLSNEDEPVPRPGSVQASPFV
jgi:hypothetical protein